MTTLKERILLALVEEMNSVQLSEPENSIPAFLERAATRLEEICQDEVRFGARKT